jgi:hypothetical protein
MVSQVVNKDEDQNPPAENTYVAFYRLKKSPNGQPVKMTFGAHSGMKALKKLCKHVGYKSIQEFHSLSLMEVLKGNSYRDVAIWDSEMNAKEAKAKGITADVVDLGAFRESKNVAKNKGKKHVKLGWLSQKLAMTGEKRILSKMRLLHESNFTPAQIAAMPDKELSTHVTTVGGNELDDIRRDAYYQRHYGYGAGMYGED